MTLSMETARQLLDMGRRLRRDEDGADDPPRAVEQLEGVVATHNLLAREGVAYLADEVGMGKTYVALGAIALFRHFNPGFRVVVIAPRENIQQKWMKEWLTFSSELVRHPDLRVKGLDGGPARPIVACDSLRSFVREAVDDPDRDFFLRLSSFSLGTGDGEQNLRDMRRRYQRELPWLDDEVLRLHSKQDFKDNLARAICCALPVFDLVIVDEGHNLKHGFKEHVAARNRALAFVFGRPDASIDRKRFPAYGPRARRLLFLSATPIEDDYIHLWNQLDVFGRAGAFPLLASRDATEAQQKDEARRFLIRRVTSVPTANGRLTKNLYRREWRRGGVAMHDDPIRVTDPRERLVVALVQKKVAELLNNDRFGSSFQMGMLASFESFMETVKLKRADDEASTFDGTDQTEKREEREGIDVNAVNNLARDYRARFGEELPHPKMDGLVARLRSSWEDGRKALVFMRRVASVWEVKERLDLAYNRWIYDLLRDEFTGSPRIVDELNELISLYEQERGDHRRRRSLRDAARDRQDDLVIEDDRGGLDTFFAWFFRGEGPKGRWLSGARLSQRLTQAKYSVATVLEDNYVASLLGVSPSECAEALAAAVGVDVAHVAREVNTRGAWFLTRARRFGKGELFDAAQGAAVEWLKDQAQNSELRAAATAVWHQRFEGRRKASPNTAGVEPAPALGTRTLFSALREQRWAPLRELTWREPASDDFERAFTERELRRQLAAGALRLGHAALDFYPCAMRERGTLRTRSESEEGGELDDQNLIDALLDLLERQRVTPRSERRWGAFDELRDLNDHFDLIVDVNAPEARRASLQDARTFAPLLREQQPVAGMTGEVNRTLVRQFRMPGYPLVLLTTDLLQEGEDLHTFCSDVYHYGIAWTPSAIEQRTGRVDRVRSKTERALLANADEVDESDKLQVYFPYLEDTVERLQVRRVLVRMPEFLKLMHEGLGGGQAHGSTLNVAREIFERLDDLPRITTPLETAFPITDAMLRGRTSPLAVTSADVARWQQRLDAVCRGALADLQVEWEPARHAHVRFGTLVLKSLGRRQPFALHLQSLGEHLLVRCVSPVGKVTVGRELDRVKDVVHRAGVQIGAIPEEEKGAYDLTVEEEVLLGDEAVDEARVRWLVGRVAREADAVERALLGKDEPLASFESGLAREGSAIPHGD